MTARANPHTAAPKLMQAFIAFSETVAKAGLEQPLLYLAAREWPVPPRILIAGSLYLAGEVLRLNGTPPA